jgi:hypothetical protein
MKKIIAIIALLLFVSGCNISSIDSGINNSGTQNSSAVSSETISAISISTTSNLKQFIGLNNVFRATALLSGGSTSTRIEWYINDVLSLNQSTTEFEFVTNSVNTYNIYAKVGNKKSNTLVYEVQLPSLSITNIKDTSSTALEVVAESGLTFNITGISLATSSYYNLANRTYYLNLLTPMVQGTNYNVRVSKSGFSDLNLTYLYENRTLNLGYILYDGEKISPLADGTYRIIRPFSDSNTPTTTNYTLSFVHKNLEGTSVPLSIITNVPATATTVSPIQTTTTIVKDSNINRSFTFRSDSIAGLYVHNIQIGGLNLTVRINLVPASPLLDLGSPIVFDDATASGSTYIPMTAPFAKDADDEYIKDVIKTEVNSLNTYIVYKPYNGPAKELTFLLDARFFQTPLGYPSDGNPYTILAAVSGPFGSAMNYGNTVNSLTPSYPFRSTIGSSYRVSQYIDNKTLVGSYVYSFTAVGVGVSLNRNITIIVREFMPELVPLIKANGESIKANTDGSFTLFKPLGTNEITTSIQMNVKYYESLIFGAAAATEGMDTTYDVDGAGGGTELRYYLNYSVSYSGPLSGVVSTSSKIGIELGQSGITEDDDDVEISNTTSQEATPKTYKRYKSVGTSAIVTLPDILDPVNYPTGNIFAAKTTLTSASFPGTHIYTIRIGRLTFPLIIKVEEPKPMLILKETSLKYGPTSDSAVADNVKLDKTDGKYYVNGNNSFLRLNIFPFGMPSGNYPYTFTTKSPTGLFQSVSNVVQLTLRVDDTPDEGVTYDERYDGTLKFPDSGIGSDMNVSQKLTEVGEYIYSYNINNSLLVVTVVVLPLPQLKDESVSYNETQLAYFEGYYYTKHSVNDRFMEITTIPLNIEETYTYVVTTNGSFPIGSDLTAAKKDIVVVNGKVIIGVNVPLSSSASDVINTYFISIYKGNTRIGEINKVFIVSQPERSTVFFNTNGGSNVNPTTQAVGATLTLPSNPTRTGHTFIGWFNNPVFEGTMRSAGFSYTTTEEDLIWHAKFNLNYTITYSNLINGNTTNTNPATYHVGTSTITLSPASGGTGTFAGWFDALTGGNQVTTIPIGSTGNKTLFARFS